MAAPDEIPTKSPAGRWGSHAKTGSVIRTVIPAHRQRNHALQ